MCARSAATSRHKLDFIWLELVCSRLDLRTNFADAMEQFRAIDYQLGLARCRRVLDNAVVGKQYYPSAKRNKAPLSRSAPSASPNGDTTSNYFEVIRGADRQVSIRSGLTRDPSALVVATNDAQYCSVCPPGGSRQLGF
jgi:hypothetical protein